MSVLWNVSQSQEGFVAMLFIFSSPTASNSLLHLNKRRLMNEAVSSCPYLRAVCLQQERQFPITWSRCCYDIMTMIRDEWGEREDTTWESNQGRDPGEAGWELTGNWRLNGWHNSGPLSLAQQVLSPPRSHPLTSRADYWSVPWDKNMFMDSDCILSFCRSNVSLNKLPSTHT